MAEKSVDNSTILLDKYCAKMGTKVSKVFTGRDRGKEVRELSQLDEIFDKYNRVHIVLPKDLFSITPSFLEEYFVNIIKKEGREGFREKVMIDDNGYQIDIPLEVAIQRILQTKTGLDK